MPALGIVCEITGERLRIEQCISCAQDPHARGLCTLEPAIIRAMWEEEEADLGVRITRLTGCLRGSCLQNRVDFWWTTDHGHLLIGRFVAEIGLLGLLEHVCRREGREGLGALLPQNLCDVGLRVLAAVVLDQLPPRLFRLEERVVVGGKVVSVPSLQLFFDGLDRHERRACRARRWARRTIPPDKWGSW